MNKKLIYISLSLLSSVTAQEPEHQAAVDKAAETIEIAAKDIDEQNKGNYPRLVRQGSLGAIQHAWDKAGQGDGSYSVTYSQQEVIRLKLREFMTTTVVLPSWEKIEDVVVGDSNSFEANKATEHIVLMKPKDFIGADSSITVIGGSGIVYSFYVRSEGFNSKNIPDLKVNVHVPGEVPQSFPDPIRGESGLKASSSSESSSSESTYPQEIAPKMGKLNWNWSMSGKREDRDIAPLKVFSDGVRTWFDFGERFEEQRHPIIFLVRDGVDVPVNFRTEGTMIVALGVGVFTLRSGAKKICVYPSHTKKA